MKRIALIVPKGSKYGSNILLKKFLERNNVVSGFYGAWETPNLSLLTIAGSIPDTYEISFIDEDHGQYVDFNEKYDIVALTGMTQQIIRAYEICGKFRENGAYVVIGGIHASLMANEALDHADTVFIGEGEFIWNTFIRDYENGTPQKKYTCSENIDLTRSPIPKYEVLDKSLYGSFGIQTTRGCPRSCNYCTLPIIYGNTFRNKTVEQVLNEIKAVKRVEQSPFIFFADDNMFIFKDYAKKLLIEIEKLDIIWGTQTDISVAEDEELLTLLYKAGCHWLFIGFENVSETGLNFLDSKKWKAKQLGNYQRSIDKIHQHGINIWGSFMFGGDNDTMNVFQDTVDFTLRNGLYSGSFTILTPLPGTELFKKMEEDKRIIDYDWRRYTFWDVIYQPQNMSPDDLSQGVAWVYDQFYSKDNVARRTGEIRKRLKDARKYYAELL